MAVGNWRFEGAISRVYMDRQMAMINEVQVLDGDNCPIHLTEAKFNAIPLVQQVLDILSKQMNSPLDRARVSPQDSPAIAIINAAYKSAMQSYVCKFNDACEKDAGRIKQERILPDSFFCALVGRVFRVFNGHYQRMVEGGSAHRYAWMIAIGTEENRRRADAEIILKRRGEVLVSELKEEMAQGFGNEDKENELSAINNLYKAMFPGRPLILNNENVTQFLISFYASNFTPL